MEWLIAVLTVVCTPLFTYLGVVRTTKTSLDNKKLELTDKDKKELSGVVDVVVQHLEEVRQEQTKLSYEVSDLKKDVAKHNEMMSKIYEIDRRLAVLEVQTK